MRNQALRRLRAAVVASIAIGVPLFAQSVPDITYDANADVLTLPAYGEVAGVATNSKGHVLVYARTGHAVATLGDERTFYHNGSRLFQFDQTGKFVKEIGQGVYAVNFAQQVRVDPQDNIWIVDAGSSQVVKFDADGRFQLVLGRKPENINVRPGPGVPASGGMPAEGAVAGGRGGEGGRGGRGTPGAGIPGDAFNRPSDVAWDRAGNIYVADGYGGNNRIAKFTKDGDFLKSWGQTGSAQQAHPGLRRRWRLQVADREHRDAAGDLRLGRVDAVPVQLELERSREHGSRGDLQDPAERTNRRQVRQGRQAAEGIRHRQRHRLPHGKRSVGRRDLELARAKGHPEALI